MPEPGRNQLAESLSTEESTSHGVPGWVKLLCVALALIEPLTHAALTRLDSDTQTFSGLHTHDSAIFLVCMASLENGFYSPYATCEAPDGAYSTAYLPTPFHWLYAIVGAAGRLFGLDPFVFLGIANGFFGFIYLITAYHFLRVTVPRVANRAFVLFALGGGLGGIAYAVSWVVGVHQSPEFEQWFWRFLMYDLHEGPQLAPVLHMPRLYYTVSIALAIGAVTAFVQSVRMPCVRHWWFAAFLLFGSTVINVRFGGFGWAICAAYCLAGPESIRPVVRNLIAPTLALVTGLGVFAAMTAMSPSMAENSVNLVRETLWPTAFLSAAAFYLVPLAWVLRNRIGLLPARTRGLVAGGTAYLVLIAGFFAGHVIYYGSFWSGGDHAAIVQWSDAALILAAPFAIWGWSRRRTGTAESAGIDWFLVWTLGFLALGFSAFGQGWGARLVPQRVLVLLGLPLSVITVYALDQWRSVRPRLASAYYGAAIACGLVSISVASLFVQYPLGQSPVQSPFAWLHAEHVTPADAKLADHVRRGYVLTPRLAADRIAIRPGARVLGGYGAADLADQPAIPLDEEVAHFFSGATEAERRAIVARWCIDYVYCPDGLPVPEETLADLRHYDWLEATAQAGGGVVFRVRD